MKTTDLVEAIQTADKIFRDKHGAEMHIFGIEWDSYEHDNRILIKACKSVVYNGRTKEDAETVGKLPHMDISIGFTCDDGVVVDRDVREELGTRE